jgi:putative transposase
MSERRACELVGLWRSVKRYVRCPDRNGELRQALKELAESKPRIGYRQLYDRLCRQGWRVNHKRLERLYAQEGLALRRKRRSVKIVCERRPHEVPSAVNRHWSMDFVHDALFNGRRFRCLTIIDIKSRFIPGIEVAFSIPGERVVAVLDRLKQTRGVPEMITVDNGPEFRSRVVKKWARDNQVTLDYIEPGKPIQNAFIESFHATFRQECLDGHWFIDMADAREKIEAFRQEYNTERPHRSIGKRTPAELEQELNLPAEGGIDMNQAELLTYNWT